MLLDIVKPILDRLNAVDISTVDGRVRAKIPVKTNNQTVEYIFLLADDNVVYQRVGSNIMNMFAISEIPRINHVLAPLYQLILDKTNLFTEISSTDIMVRLHLLLPGDVFVSTSRIIFQGAGSQRTQDIYIVK